jgi:branched-chain amino acid transport system substrate-binding protein
MFKRTGLTIALLTTLTAGPALADVNVCVWGTITGPDALVNGMSYGTRDYLDFVNKTKGGIAGQKVNIVFLDGRYRLDEELKIYRRCIDQENAVVVNGWSTGAIKALRDQINQDKTTFITESFSSEVLDPKEHPYIFMAGPTYEQQIIVGLRDLAGRKGKTAVLMHGDNEYGRGPVNVVRKSGDVQKAGVQLIDTVEFRFDTQDVTAQLLRVKSRNPDLIFVQASTPQVLVILRDAAKVGIPSAKFMGNLYNISPTIPEQLGASANGFRSIQAYADFGDDIPAMKQINAYKAAGGQIEKTDMYYMKGWFKGIAIAAAIENAIKKNGGAAPADVAAFRKSVRDELEALKNLDVGGITPPADFSNHQGSIEARVAEIKDGKYVPVGDWIEAK